MSSLNKIIILNKIKHLVLENELKKLKAFDSSYFYGKSYFEEDGTQNCLVFQPIHRYFKRIDSIDNASYKNYVYYWKSKGLSDEKINSIKTTDYRTTPHWDYYNTAKIRVKFNGSCLKQDQPILLYGGIVNVYIFYEITNNFNVSSYPTLESGDIGKYGYSNYGIEFGRKWFFNPLLKELAKM